MKKIALIFCFFIPFIAFGGSKTDSVVIINKIPHAGILLNRGWRFHAGDDPGWAKPGIDDSEWDPVDPSKDIYELPQVRKAEIGWFRLKMKVDPSLCNQTLALMIVQTGASEIYLNGRLLYSFGRVSKEYTREKTLQMYGNPFSFKFDNQSTQVISVRYSFTRKNFYTNYLSPNLCLQFTLNKVNEGFSTFMNAYDKGGSEELILIALYLLLGLMSLFLYFSFRIQKAYLNFGIYCIMTVFVNALTLRAFSLPMLPVSSAAFLYFGSYLLGFISNIILLQGIYMLYKQSKSPVYYIGLIYTIFAVPIFFFLYTWTKVTAFLFFDLVAIEILRVLFIAVRNKTPGARILFATIFCAFLMGLVFVFEDAAGNFTLAYAIGAIVLLSYPLGLSFFLASEYARTGWSLLARVIEVKRLSEKTVAQEKEKQQLLASQNEILEEQVTERTAALNQSIINLKAAQNQLIQSEKMASLGELTAGIAHEIQNPLNFVNNFSEVNTELINEMQEEINKGNLEEVKAISEDIKENQKLINQHGKRADGIVKGMLQHSRLSTGERQLTNINALADEFFKLSYHGLRAKDKSFNSEMINHFDPDLPKMNVVPQDIGRVLLNLFNNAFYAVNQKKKTADEGYKPEVSVSTSTENGQVIIKVKDNGIGIPDSIKEKIMQPFFTTKPTGEGTGLGLSLTYDIVVKGHGGNIQVNSVEGEGSEFLIKLPVN